MYEGRLTLVKRTTYQTLNYFKQLKYYAPQLRHYIFSLSCAYSTGTNFLISYSNSCWATIKCFSLIRTKADHGTLFAIPMKVWKQPGQAILYRNFPLESFIIVSCRA